MQKTRKQLEEEIKELKKRLSKAAERCPNCGQFHPDYKGDYCPARDDSYF